MKGASRFGVQLIGLWLLFMLSGCGLLAPGSCDGISAEIGGCDDDRPVFASDSCEGIGQQIGVEVDRRVMAVIGGPEVTDGKFRSVRIKDALNLVASLANQQVRALGLQGECTSAELFSFAEREFSDELVNRIGDHAYDGAVITYDQWVRDDVMFFLGVVDREE